MFNKIFLSCVILFTCLSFIDAHKNIKILVLIIASDQFEVYKELQKVWRSYMHLDPEHVEVYFLKGNEYLSATTLIEDDIIWSKTSDGWVPVSAGILNKTILSLEMMMPRIHEFDYILRTNLSSFYVFPRMLKFLETLPKTRCYCGSAMGDGTLASGCGFIMSPDVVEMLVNNKDQFLNVAHVEDDVIIGRFMKDHGISLLPQARMDFYSLSDWFNRGSISEDVFQFRVKNSHELRLTDDIYIHAELLKIFYDISFKKV